MSPTFELSPIQTISPSLAEVLRKCPLQAGISRISAIRGFVLGNPRGWLGTAYHEVLERLQAPTDADITDRALAENLWERAIAKLQQQAVAHPLDRRFSVPEEWPGYHLVRACALARAEQSLAKEPRTPAFTGPSGTVANTIREQKLTAMDGRLVGKPDIIKGNEICDYKSGEVYDEIPDGKRTVRQGYVRQLRLYGHLVHETYGQCPTKGKLLPMQGETVEISLDSDTCAEEATAAVGLLEAFNSQLAAASDIRELAFPSPGVCRWCQFKALCPAFWQETEDSWVDELGGAAVRGILNGPPSTIHNNRAVSLSICVSSGTTAAAEVTIAPFDKGVHAELAEMQDGDEARIVGLYCRRDGQLAPTRATVCLRDTACPSIKLPGAASL